jgi:hypothetical protein
MDMRRLLAGAAALFGVCLATTARADRSVITTSGVGRELTVVVHGVTDYCSTNATTEVVRHGETIRIIRDRPTVVSRCMTERDLTFILRDLPPGRYTISYETTPLVAPARFIKLASTIVNVTE